MDIQLSYRDQISNQLFGSTNRSFDFYFKVYDSLVSHNDYVLQIEDLSYTSPITITHDDILAATNVLRDDPALTLDQACSILRERLRPRLCSNQQLKRAITISVRITLMLDCDRNLDAWKPDERFVDYVSVRFPRTSGPSETVKEVMASKKSIKAWKLKTRCRLSFRGTDILARHLALDPSHPDGPTLYIFHHTTFLKAHLDRLKVLGIDIENGILPCLRRHGVFPQLSPFAAYFTVQISPPHKLTQTPNFSGCPPPRLLVETLHSIQGILFHFDDHRSSRILSRLINRGGFDHDCAQHEGYKIIEDPKGLEYMYWGERLATLHKFLHDRPARNKFERWIKWQTSESNAFAVALFALFISVIVGILSLGMAGVQTWIAYKAWKEPVNGGAG
ncbi:hypothetical protein PG995_006013 [Apiospora arundinis]